MVSDVAAARIAVLAPDGSLRLAFGRKGNGPDELLAPSVIEPIGGSEIAVLDNRRARVAVFDAATGEFQRAVRLPGPAIDMRYDVTSGHLFIGSAQTAIGTTLARWDLRSDTTVAGGRLPSAYREFPRLMRNLAMSAIGRSDKGIWVGPLGTNEVELYHASDLSAPAQAVELPRIARRGIPFDRPELLQREMSYEDEVQSVSMLMTVGTLSNGRLAAVHQDFSITGQLLSRTAFLSIIDPVSRTGCADLPVDASSDVTPVLRVLGNALYLVGSRVDQTADSTVTSIRIARLDTLGCSRT